MSARRGQPTSADHLKCPMMPGIFFYVKFIYTEQLLTPQQIWLVSNKIDEHCLEVGNNVLQCKCKAHWPMKEQYFHQSFIHQEFKTYGFHIEKNPWPDLRQSGHCWYLPSLPCRHWLRNKNRLGFKRWDVSQKCSNWACARKSIQSLFVHWNPA